MREHPDHHDAELLLRLYDLRREAKLRQAREWFLHEFKADSPQDLLKRYPRGSQENAFYRMVISYWEMAASFVTHGLISEELFFENTNELWIVWEKIRHLAPETRKRFENPHIWKNLETTSEKFEKWFARRAPQGIEALRRLVVEGWRDK